MSNKGFTLLEVIIAITILAFISIYTAKSVQSGLKSKAKIQKNIDKDALLRDALKVVANDIRLAFNYRDINIELFNKAQEQRKKNYYKKKPAKPKDPDDTNPPDPDQTTTAKKPKDFKLKKEVVLTHFIGRKDEIHFTSSSYMRSQESEQTSNLAEVGYFLKSCTNRVNKDRRSQCLWRRITPYIDDKVDEDGSETALLENVTTFRLRYLGPKKEEEWVDSWLSTNEGDVITQNKFPYAVEITIEVHDKNSPKETKPMAMTMVTPISFSNNYSEEKRQTDAKNAQQTTKTN